MIEMAVVDVGDGLNAAVVAALQGVRRRLRVVAIASADGERRASLAGLLAVEPEGLFASATDLLRRLPVDVCLVMATSQEGNPVVLEAIARGTHVVACRDLFDDPAFAATVAQQARQHLVKVAAAPPVADDDGRGALEGALTAFADYLEEGLGDYPGKDLIPPPEPL